MANRRERRRPARNAHAEPPTSALRNPTAGLASPAPESGGDRRRKESDRIAPADAAIDALAVSELSHVTEEARVFVALGHPDRAIEVLQEHIRRLPRSMPAAWLMLLGLHHARGNRPEFRRLAEDFHVHFNVQTPLWEGFATEERGNRRARALSPCPEAGGRAVAQAGMPRLSRAPPLRQPRGPAQRISARDLRRHPDVAAGPGRAGGHRHRHGSRRRRQARHRCRCARDRNRTAAAGVHACAKTDAAGPCGVPARATAHPLRPRSPAIPAEKPKS